jgi:hypothetical protein
LPCPRAPPRMPPRCECLASTSIASARSLELLYERSACFPGFST